MESGQHSFLMSSFVSLVSTCSVKIDTFGRKFVMRNCFYSSFHFFLLFALFDGGSLLTSSFFLFFFFFFLLLSLSLANYLTSEVVQLEHAPPVMARFDRLLVRLEVKISILLSYSLFIISLFSCFTFPNWTVFWNVLLSITIFFLCCILCWLYMYTGTVIFQIFFI